MESYFVGVAHGEDGDFQAGSLAVIVENVASLVFQL